MALVAVVELGGDESRRRLRSLHLDRIARSMVDNLKKQRRSSPLDKEKKLTKDLIDTYLKLTGLCCCVAFSTSFAMAFDHLLRWKAQRDKKHCEIPTEQC